MCVCKWLNMHISTATIYFTSPSVIPISIAYFIFASFALMRPHTSTSINSKSKQAVAGKPKKNM